jgi:hypothetical protein
MNEATKPPTTIDLATEQDKGRCAPAPGSAIGTATRVVSAILKELRGRKGFGWWWEHIDEQAQNELLFTLMEKVEAIISPKNGLGAAGAQMQGRGRDTASQQTLPPNDRA